MEEINYWVFECPRGWISVLGSSRGLLRLSFPCPTPSGALSRIRDAVKSGAAENPGRFQDLAHRLDDYFLGRRAFFPDPLDLSGATPFQREVWEAARQIRGGETRSYGWLAEKLGRRGGARAVGQALGKNPLPIIVPCHRVIGSRGDLCGFSAGLGWKEELLRLEAAAVPSHSTNDKQEMPLRAGAGAGKTISPGR